MDSNPRALETPCADQPTAAERFKLETLSHAAAAKQYETSTPLTVVVLAREITVSRRPVHQTSMMRSTLRLR
jgi:hypothetical protein